MTTSQTDPWLSGEKPCGNCGVAGFIVDAGAYDGGYHCTNCGAYDDDE